MEITGNGNYQINLSHLRQSDAWIKYLEGLGWHCEITKSGIKIAYYKSPIGTVTKIQKPRLLNKQDLEEIEEICRKLKVMFIKIEPWMGQDMEIFKEKGYQVSKFPLSPTTTMIMDLRLSEAELWDKVSHSGKYSIRRAEREKNIVEYFVNPDADKLKSFQEICEETGRRGKFYVVPFKELLLRKEAFQDKSYLLEVYDDSRNLVSSKFYVGDHNTVTYIQGGTSHIGRKGKGGYELMWKSFLYFKKLGYEFLDLEGLDDPRFPLFTNNWGGFSHFKEKFNGMIVRYPSLQIKFLNSILAFMAKISGAPL